MIQALLPGVLERRPPLPLENAFPGERFGAIAADPPWLYQNFTRAVHGAAKAHYDCLSLEELQGLPVASVALRGATASSPTRCTSASSACTPAPTSSSLRGVRGAAGQPGGMRWARGLTRGAKAL
jgi:hypothetical protein